MRPFKFLVIGITVLLLGLMVTSGLMPSRAAAAQSKGTRYNVITKNAKAYKRAVKRAKKMGAEVVLQMKQINTLTARSTDANFATKMNKVKGVTAVGKDQARRLVRPARQTEFFGKPFTVPTAKPARTNVNLKGAALAPQALQSDPATTLPGLLWQLPRIAADENGAWQLTSGDPAVIVAVEDTGVDYTHAEIAPHFDAAHSVYLHDPLCLDLFGLDDQMVGDLYFGGAPADLDYNGHGSWIAGAIGAVADGKGINGIAPNVKIAAIKISDWCGGAYDSTIAYGFIWGADHGIDVINLSFGGFIDISDPGGYASQQMAINAVKYAYAHGTAVAHSAGNDSTRLDQNGMVTSYAAATVPGDPLEVVQGLYTFLGVGDYMLTVSSTGNVVMPASEVCPGDSADPGPPVSTAAWCKPTSDAHQPNGPGTLNNLAYYSNYGPGISVAGPGGARMFNMFAWDRGGTPGWPYTGIGSLYPDSASLGFNTFEDFGITSNYTTQIDCFTFTGGGFPPDNCYTAIQGTSMAAPQVAGVMALIASRNLDARGHPNRLFMLVKNGANKDVVNYTPELSATDTSPADQTGAACPSGYCHLGGPTISWSDAFGAGLVNAWGSLTTTR